MIRTILVALGAAFVLAAIGTAARAVTCEADARKFCPAEVAAFNPLAFDRSAQAIGSCLWAHLSQLDPECRARVQAGQRPSQKKKP